MMFFITAASGFEKEAKKEILNLVNGKISHLFMKGLLVLETEEPAEKVIQKADTVYVSKIIPVQKKIIISKTRDSLDRIAEAASELNGISSGETFAVRCKRRGMHDFTSRDVEKAVGEKIDAEANLINPDRIISVQIIQDVCFLGIFKAGRYVVKKLESGKKYEHRPLNRAEFKLREAIDIFGIKPEPGWRALDIGASPGGWTKVLSEKLKEVVAVDPGELEISLPNVVHIRKKIENADLSGKFDIIVNDMNLEPAESAHMMCLLSEHLREKGIAVMTVKFVTSNRKKHISDAKDILSKCYDVRGIKRMPHNRKETTVYMVKKG